MDDVTAGSRCSTDVHLAMQTAAAAAAETVADWSRLVGM